MDFSQAIKELEQGNVVAIPTETVYGLAADATNQEAIKKIFALKNRPSDNPLIVHVGSKNVIVQYANIRNNIEKLIIDKLMPWPITLLLEKKDIIPDITTAWSSWVAIRIPNHTIALDILQQSNLALAAPSANISWSPSPTTAAMVYKNFGDSVHIVDGGPCTVWIESTVVQVQDNAVLIHRPGFITPDDIASVVWPTVQVTYSNTETNISPGIKYKHYSPKARIHILYAWYPLPQISSRIGLLVTDEWIQTNQYDIEQSNYHTYRWGSHKNLLECAQNLYSSYHQADSDAINDLYVEALPETNGVAYAIMNRIKKSSQ